jgi:hypothetical protein
MEASLNQEAALNLADSDADDAAAPEARSPHPQTRRRAPKGDADDWSGTEPASIVRKVKVKKRPNPSSHPLPRSVEVGDAVLRDVARNAKVEIRKRCVQEGSSVYWNVVERYCAAYVDFRSGDTVAFYLLQELQSFLLAYRTSERTEPNTSREPLTLALLYKKTDEALTEIETDLINAIKATTEKDNVPGVKQPRRRLIRFIHLPHLPHERFVVKYKPGAQISVRTLDREVHFRKKIRGTSHKPRHYHKRRMNHHKRR